MATHIKLDSTGDLEVLNGQTALVSGSAEVAQRARTNLLLIKGEAITDKDAGVDYFGRVFGSAGQGRKELADAELQRVLMATEGVRRLRQYTSTLDAQTRALTISAQVEYDDGATGTLTLTGIG